MGIRRNSWRIRRRVFAATNLSADAHQPLPLGPLDLLASLDVFARSHSVCDAIDKLIRIRMQFRVHARQIAQDRMPADSVKPILGVAKIAFAAMHDAVPETSLRRAFVLADRVRPIQIPGQQPQTASLERRERFRRITFQQLSQFAIGRTVAQPRHFRGLNGLDPRLSHGSVQIGQPGRQVARIRCGRRRAIVKVGHSLEACRWIVLGQNVGRLPSGPPDC
ncbi:hypothetical protein-signal peptide prediction [Rhodopirellula baltica SH 1]|uniref:Uncharacterized protein n=1 Tax=Rhodopirellula baltica (strain DSM 10527 / NCIMB 13988 / SH1) TaxID=243090 RepID=Q7UWH6_RHOBA|nr:hypothetical protein-signal peptide prediction [Rhodopirellula baltica SH 1]